MAKDDLAGTSATARHRFDYSPWRFWSEADADARAQQLDLQRRLAAQRPDHVFGEHCFISALAAVDNEALQLGARSYIAAGAYLTGALRTDTAFSLLPQASAPAASATYGILYINSSGQLRYIKRGGGDYYIAG